MEQNRRIPLIVLGFLLGLLGGASLAFMTIILALISDFAINTVSKEDDNDFPSLTVGAALGIGLVKLFMWIMGLVI